MILISIVVALGPAQQHLIPSLLYGTMSTTLMRTIWSTTMTSTPHLTDMVTHRTASPAHHHTMIVIVTMTD